VVAEKIVMAKLKEQRKFLYELALEIKIPESRLRRLLKGRTQPRAGEMERIAAGLSIPIQELGTGVV